MKRILFLPGDGIGKEVSDVGLFVLNKILKMLNIECIINHGDIGWSAYDIHGDSMPEVTWAKCHAADAIVLGAVGLPDRNKEVDPDMLPERRALLALREKMGFGCNIRPIKVFGNLMELSPIKEKFLKGGIDLTFFRELSGGDYFGRHTTDPDNNWAEDVSRYTREQVESIARAAFQYAQKYGKSVTSVDKANVLASVGTFWRDVVTDLHKKEFPDIELNHQYVDSMNLLLFIAACDSEVILTSNGYGDILSDGAAGLAGSMGLLPSASINTSNGKALYEPSGGSAPDIAGLGIANPVAMILSIAMLLRHSLDNEKAAKTLEDATYLALKTNRTKDVATENFRGNIVGPKGMGEIIVERFHNLITS